MFTAKILFYNLWQYFTVCIAIPIVHASKYPINNHIIKKTAVLGFFSSTGGHTSLYSINMLIGVGKTLQVGMHALQET